MFRIVVELVDIVECENLIIVEIMIKCEMNIFGLLWEEIIVVMEWNLDIMEEVICEGEVGVIFIIGLIGGDVVLM